MRTGLVRGLRAFLVVLLMCTASPAIAAQRTFVHSNSSGDVKSAGNNFIADNVNATPATTYITSFTTVALK